MKFEINIGDNHSLVCKELAVSQYKQMLKTLWPETPAPKPTLNNLFDIFSELTDRPASFFYNLNLIQIFLIILDIRIMSFGSVCKLILGEDEEISKNTTISLNLILVRQELFRFLENHSKQITVDGIIQAELRIPSINRLLNDSAKEHFLFLNKATYVPQNKSIEINDNALSENIFNSFPAKLSGFFIKNVKETVNELHSINFLANYSSLEKHKLSFFLTADCLIWYTKLLFSEPLDVFYDNLFYLAHLGNLSLEYIEKCSPGEYTYMVNKLENTLKSKQQNQDEQSATEFDEEFSPEDF